MTKDLHQSAARAFVQNLARYPAPPGAQDDYDLAGPLDALAASFARRWPVRITTITQPVDDLRRAYGGADHSGTDNHDGE